MKNFIKILAVIALFVGVWGFAGCSEQNKKEDVDKLFEEIETHEEKKEEGNTGNNTTKTADYKIVSLSFAGEDWARELTAGLDNYEIDYLLKNGVDIHSFQPSAEDILKISKADLVIYGGGESDEWVEDVLDEHNFKGKSVNMMQIMGDKALIEEMKEGMQETEDAHDHDHDDIDDKDDHDDHDHDHDEPEMDEHVFLSVKNAKLFLSSIAKALKDIDSANQEKIAENEKNYLEKLDTLDKEYEEAVKSAKNKTLIFGDRFPFRYLIEDYNLDYYAAFKGCSADTEADFDTVIYLANKTSELKIPCVYVLEKGNKDLGEEIVKNSKSNAEVVELNSMQSVTTDDINNGMTFIGVMEDNLLKLKKGLGE